jgi:endonuclease/exonuclease/phosphatase family metal-dependent hydrolase
MMRASKIIAALVLGLALFIGAYLLANSGVAAKPQDIVRVAREGLPPAGDDLTIVTWNLGYAGLGAGSDFAVDGGKHYFPPSREAVLANAAGIASFLETQSDADVILLEELAHGGPINRWVNLKQRVDAALADRDQLYFADFKTRLMPWPLHMSHGQGIYARRAIEGADVIALPAENSGILGVRRRYASLVSRLPIEGQEGGWTVASVHLAAFDEDAAVRTHQLRELMAWAQQEYASGRHVVIGGDWNLRLVDTNFPSTTEEQYLFWVFPFPMDALPEGWRIAADAGAPSVRTNERAYTRNENYRTVIDGFIVSPNVSIEEIHGIDLDFQNSDHNPVRVRVRAVRGANP